MEVLPTIHENPEYKVLPGPDNISDTSSEEDIYEALPRYEPQSEEVRTATFTTADKGVACAGVAARFVCSPLLILLTCAVKVCLALDREKDPGMVRCLWGCDSLPGERTTSGVFCQPATVLCPTCCSDSNRKVDSGPLYFPWDADGCSVGFAKEDYPGSFDPDI